nr:type II toxin-antitoxin system RelE/ParE family toxin [Pseudoalteromonas sp. S2721]
MENALYRKLEILDAVKAESDLRVPPDNRFKHLEGNLKDWCSIREQTVSIDF